MIYIYLIHTLIRFRGKLIYLKKKKKLPF